MARMIAGAIIAAMKDFWQAFIPLFVAIDVLGLVPIYLGLTAGRDARTRGRLARQASLAALGVSLLFLFVGKWLFRYLGITEHDFKVGGGVVLLVMAVTDLLFSSEETRAAQGEIGVVPLGIPLIMGPAALAAILIAADGYGWAVTLGALLANLLIVWGVFANAERVGGLLGKSGAQGIAKIAALFLAAIAVMLIRSGLTAMIHAG